MTFIQRSSFSRISFKYAINFSISSYSARSLSCSRPVNWRSLISTMARDCISDREKRSIKRSIASAGLLDDLMIAMTSSILSEAIIRPSKIWARSSAFFKSYFVRRITTSCLWSTNALIKSFRLSSLGRPFTNAILLTLKEDCNAVILYSLLSTTLEFASLFTSTTILMPWRSDSSFTFDMPSMRFSFTKSAIYLISSALFTP